MRHVPFADVTAIDSLRTFIQDSSNKGIHVVFCEANPLVQNRLSRAHLIDWEHTDHFNRSLEQALSVANQTACS
ncbi:MAG: sodium-independent anion transporter [Opitutales bacterium]|nr:sodium-independent anion transporter [Opitutales bacterium]